MKIKKKIKVELKANNQEKDSFYAKTAFFLSLGFWIPLFNIGLAIVSIFLALKALKLSEKNPKKYGGRKHAIIALILSVSALALTLAGVTIFGLRKLLCE